MDKSCVNCKRLQFDDGMLDEGTITQFVCSSGVFKPVTPRDIRDFRELVQIAVHCSKFVQLVSGR